MEKNKKTLIFVQVETTGFNSDVDQVIIIAAETENLQFSRKIIPTVPIKSDANEINHLSVVNGLLYYECELIFKNIVKRRQAWIDFINFISQYKNAIIIGYNIQLQEKFIKREISSAGLEERFINTIGSISFADSIHMFKEILPDYIESYQLKDIAEKHLDFFKYEAWEYYALPLYKLYLLRCLMLKLNVSLDIIIKHSVTV